MSKAGGEFRGYVGVPADAFSFRRIVYILGHANVTSGGAKYSQRVYPGSVKLQNVGSKPVDAR